MLTKGKSYGSKPRKFVMTKVKHIEAERGNVPQKGLKLDYAQKGFNT